MKEFRISDKIKNIFTDTVWSAAGLVLMHASAQFLVYPLWNRELGNEEYGNIVYLLSVMNILAISIGSGINYARMRRSAEVDTSNRPYLLLMAAGTLLSLLILSVMNALCLLHLDRAEFLLFCCLTVATMWRCYADVEYRLHINYRGFFLYYVVIGLGYMLGFWLFRISGLWPLALLSGELLGLGFVLWRGRVFRKDTASEPLSPVLHVSLLLVSSGVLSQLFFNGDRLILRLFSGSTAVTVYYIASLFGKTMTFISTPMNGVLVGHLAKHNGILTQRMMYAVSIITVGAVILFTLVCVAMGFLLLPMLYPAEWYAVKPFLWITSASQVVYFAGNVLISSFLLRFTKARNQLTVNVVYGAFFLAICIPLAAFQGIAGFCWGLLAVNAFRLILCLTICCFAANRQG